MLFEDRLNQNTKNLKTFILKMDKSFYSLTALRKISTEFFKNRSSRSVRVLENIIVNSVKNHGF